MWAVNSPPSARKPMTSTAPAVVLRTAGSSQPPRSVGTNLAIVNTGTSMSYRLPRIRSTCRLPHAPKIEERSDPLACDADGDSDHGIGKAQQGLMPGISRTDGGDDHDNDSRNARRDDVVTAAQGHHD